MSRDPANNSEAAAERCSVDFGRFVRHTFSLCEVCEAESRRARIDARRVRGFLDSHIADQLRGRAAVCGRTTSG